jgi:hypothetical protein
MGIGYPGSTFFEDMGLPPIQKENEEKFTEEEYVNFKKELLNKLKKDLENQNEILPKDEITKVKKTYNILWHMIHIPKEKMEELNKRKDSKLILYYLIKECGADREWQEAYAYYNKKSKIAEYIGNSMDQYICDSEYESYLQFRDLKEEIQSEVNIEGTRGISYSEYIKTCIKDETE